MNAFAANDFEAADVEAADLLALARLDDDGAPCPSGLPQSEPRARTIASAAGLSRRPLTPALMGVG